MKSPQISKLKKRKTLTKKTKLNDFFILNKKQVNIAKNEKKRISISDTGNNRVKRSTKKTNEDLWNLREGRPDPIK
jgi:hypothetical protein